MSGTARRAQLVEVGRSVFADRGFDAATIEEIAERAGVSKPIVYEHFGGKEGLYAVVVDREIQHIVGRTLEVIAEGPPRERLERAALEFLRYAEENPAGFAVLSRDTPGGLPTLLTDVAARVGEIFTSEFRRAGFDARAAPIYAHALVGMVTFVGQWWTKTRQPPIEEVAAHIVGLAWMGLRHLPRSPTLATAPRGGAGAGPAPG
ncbi:MAG: TetR/AcrR family transcriptional regulator [Actinobacteria bacterium]|nr:TetR/AcrR family transcriptional regulator [Actinomycetota bacterium]